ncbi:ferrirhodotorulic acid ABC transporter, permease protein [Campylobacter pinnipediorum subsp. pinnipediorum]|uniref:Fe-S-containing protein n=1 Tax=Campylobacter pinnipediorum TaxID=1965231 RepID=UPI00099550A4|nr:Fe-S-containing protein [Campylobacter pinnipediorum]AQW80431.1 ferrirhodotorulic acid ABC transporter, permease protein [Campylobacter pinnipediorum subsp. pinnipediorum]
MSIYFFHVISSFFGLVFFAALSNKTKSIKIIFLPSIIGVLLGILIFKFARYFLIDSYVKIFFDYIAILFLIISCFCIFFEFKPVKIFTFGVLSLCFGFSYSLNSSLFPLFDSQLLDTMSIISFFLMLLGMLFSIFIFFLISNLKDKICTHIVKTASFLVVVVLLLEKISQALLESMRAGIVATHSWLLSLVAKGIYFNSFAIYFYVALSIIIALFALKSAPKLHSKDEIGSKEYRFLKAQRNFIFSNFKYSFYIIFISLCFVLYYDLYASKPPQISDPTYVEPKNDKFVFDVKELSDNKLHRYAYITDEGKEVRFFLLNRFADRASPVIVFDACMICGDMGYIKQDNDLICISCNVRIFLPSVGKQGGCNPVPMEFEFDGEYVTVDRQTIVDGSGYFSKVVEKMVLDPVSKKEVSNLTSKSYLYYGHTYFFENEKTQATFEANPEKFVDTNGTLK